MHDNETDDTPGEVEPVKPKRELPPAGAANIRRGNGAGKGVGHGGPAKGMPPRGERAPPFGRGNQAAKRS
jgi:hypothetical protein